MAIGQHVKRIKEAQELERRANEGECNEVDPDALTAVDAAEQAAAQAETSQVPLVVGAGGAVSLTFEQLRQLIAEARGPQMSPEQLVEMATKAALAGAEKVKPKELSVTEVERKSAYNPEGEKASPRKKLKCHMYFGSMPLGSPKEVTTLTHGEIAALNGLVPGHYRIRKMDGSRTVVDVKGQFNSNRELDRLWILLPEGDEQRNLYPPLADFVSQCRDENRVQPELVA